MSVDVASDSVSTVPIIVTRPAAQLSDACYVSIMSVTMGTLGPADALDRLVAPFNIPRGLYLAYFWHARDWTNVLSAGGVRAAVVKELANESMFAWVRQAFVKDFAGVVLRVKHAGLAIVLGARAEGNEMSHEREQVCRHVASWLDDGGRALLGSIDLAALGRSKQQEMLRGLYEYADDAQAWGTSQDAAIDDVHLLLRARRMTRAVLEVRVRQAREARRDEGRVTTSRRAQRGTLSVQAFRKSRVFLLLSDRLRARVAASRGGDEAGSTCPRASIRGNGGNADTATFAEGAERLFDDCCPTSNSA